MHLSLQFFPPYLFNRFKTVLSFAKTVPQESLGDYGELTPHYLKKTIGGWVGGGMNEM